MKDWETGRARDLLAADSGSAVEFPTRWASTRRASWPQWSRVRIASWPGIDDLRFAHRERAGPRLMRGKGERDRSDFPSWRNAGDVLHLLVEVAILLAVARGLGEVCQRLNQPSVVGEILAGVLLGPSVLGALAPVIAKWTIPQTQVQGYLLEVLGLIGVMLLLVITGFETDLALIRRKAKTAMGIAVGGLLVPFASGLVLGLWFPSDLLLEPNPRGRFRSVPATASRSPRSRSWPDPSRHALMLRDSVKRFGGGISRRHRVDDAGIVATLAAVGRSLRGTCAFASALAVFLVATRTGPLYRLQNPCLRQDRMKGRIGY